MKSICVRGIGAVSPAGWGMHALRDALAKGQALHTKDMARPGRSQPLKVRSVPVTSPRAAFLAHPRLRRSSPITHFAVGAALEALGDDARFVTDGSLRLGVIFCVMAGCVTYSRRFYEESLREPVMASPLIFPETVFNAPASHLSAILQTNTISYTLVGDPGMFLVGLAIGADWALQGEVDACLVIGAEETDWLLSDAYRRFNRSLVLSEGAGAVYLRPMTWNVPAAAAGPLATPGTSSRSVVLEAVTDCHSFLADCSRAQAAKMMRSQLPEGTAGQLLVLGTQKAGRSDAAEIEAWKDWSGARLEPKAMLGEGLAAASAWQCAAAIDSLNQERYSKALVSVVGCNQQAVGAQFSLVSTLHSPL
jgi:3-oxoacyl-(acyl-carrier-protein) synthase